MPRFKSIIFYQNSPKITLFLKKRMQNFQTLWASPPDPQTQPPIANIWLRTWQLSTVYNYMRLGSFCFEQFLIDRSVSILMLIIL